MLASQVGTAASRQLLPGSRRHRGWVLLVLFCLSVGGQSLAVGWSRANPSAGWPQVEAEAVVVMDAGSGRILHARNPDESLRPASTAKIMTAILALEMGRLEELVTVSRQASRVEGSRVYLDEGERQTLRDLLYALMLQSANDAAVAIAEHLAGSQDDFVRLMNEKARALGAKSTRFLTPHGLDAPGQYTTARDLALLGAYALRNPAFRQIVATRRWEMPWPAKGGVRTLYNKNRLLAAPEGTGVKTGYTVAAGHCLVGSARRGDFEVIVVLLKASRDFWEDARRLLDYTFANYTLTPLVRAGQPLDAVELSRAGKVEALVACDVNLPLTREEATSGPKLEIRVRWRPGLRPPLAAGETIGLAEIKCLDAPLLTVPVVAAQGVKASGREQVWPWVLAVAVVGGLISLRRRRSRRYTRRYPYRYLSGRPIRYPCRQASGCSPRYGNKRFGPRPR